MRSVYRNFEPIKRIKREGKFPKRVLDCENPHLFQDSNKRSTAEPGSLETVTALEFKNIEEILDKRGFGKMQDALNIVKDMSGIISVKCDISELCGFRKCGAFIYLDDGITPRKCLIAQISSASKCSVLIDMQLETCNISTLLLVGYPSTQFDNIVNIIIKRAIQKLGSWPGKLIDNMADIYQLGVCHFYLHKCRLGEDGRTYLGKSKIK